MSNPEPRVLVGDHKRERFERLKRILQKFQTKEPVCEPSFEDLEKKLRGPAWGIVFLADDLPEASDSEIVNFPAYVNRLRASYSGPIVCIVSHDEDPEPIEGVNVHIHLNSHASKKKDDKVTATVITELRVLGKWLPEKPKNPQIKPPADPWLREQLRSLSNSRDLTDGIETIASIVRKFSDCDRVEIAKLGQGKSGSRVFLVRMRKGKIDCGENVLKLVPDSDRWKIEREVERHEKASRHLTKGGLKSFIPQIVPPLQPHDANHPYLKKAVFYERWYALCYEFLGGRTLGKVLDLETALTEEPKKLAATFDGTYIKISAGDGASLNETRARVLETQLNSLSDLWYLNSKLTGRVSKPLWSYEDREPEDYPDLPPYKLTGRNKGYILSFLDSQAGELGSDFFEDWNKIVDTVRTFLERTNRRPRGDKLLSRDAAVVVSPTHGDLNCNNFLLWLEQKEHPLLIDFPMYQEAGHALQDFAKIESEIKFIAMDRQRADRANRPRALDHTYSQLPLWIEMENHLLAPGWAAPMKLSEEGHQENVLFCLSLIQMVRAKAERVQQQTLKVPAGLSFLEEYYPPLLFHTLRAIGFESLSVFKRLLAVSNASRLIEKLT